MSGNLKSDDATDEYGGGALDSLNQSLVNSWVRQLRPETDENLKRSRELSNLPDDDKNQSKRRVFNGHYVRVKPTGLPNPKLVAVSEDVALNLLKLSKEQVASDEFLQLVSGNLTLQESWSTPYALSIMGERYTNNCPFGTGDGYGDGRAISIGEVSATDSNQHPFGYEMQLKGAGKTPFARGADGRAVLRSSIREFLASEAMHWLGVPTTRALSLVVSGTETIQRPWYSESVVLTIPTMDDPRLEQFPPAQRKAILRSMRNQKADPNILISESCAITTRVAPSFMRVGHVDLFARRATASGTPYDTTSQQWMELEDIFWHACYREFRTEAYNPHYEQKDIVSAANVLLEKSMDKISSMIGHWIRVGFVQGNFNADNCLVGGYTMDYGPFGFMEEYSPVFAKWTGSGQHYGALNQPIAGLANYNTLVVAVAPLIAAKSGQDEEGIVETWMKRAKVVFQQKVSETFRVKLGFPKDSDLADPVWKELEPLLRGSRVDWTLFWRQLTEIMREYTNLESTDYDGMMFLLVGAENTEQDVFPRYSPFYENFSTDLRKMWEEWFKMWREGLKTIADRSDDTELTIYNRMRQVNPKYVMREWMLVDAYKAAAKGNYDILNSVYQLSKDPYAEGTPEQMKNYYRRTPKEAQYAGGTAFMS